jgi:hypothetical protein
VALMEDLEAPRDERQITWRRRIDRATLVPGAGGRVLLWWSEERTWIAAFPSLQAAHDFILGKEEGWPRNPGWDRSDTSIDLKPALYEYRQKNGRFPQFEFSECSNVFDLYTPLGLGPASLSSSGDFEIGSNDFEIRPIGLEHATLAVPVHEPG